MANWDPSDNSSRHQESRGVAPGLKSRNPNPRTPLPDFRFEPSYLKSIAPYLRIVLPSSSPNNQMGSGEGSTAEHQTTNDRNVTGVVWEPSIYGAPIAIQWSGVLWITVRDQVCMFHNTTEEKNMFLYDYSQ